MNREREREKQSGCGCVKGCVFARFQVFFFGGGAGVELFKPPIFPFYPPIVVDSVPCE